MYADALEAEGVHMSTTPETATLVEAIAAEAVRLAGGPEFAADFTAEQLLSIAGNLPGVRADRVAAETLGQVAALLAAN